MAGSPITGKGRSRMSLRLSLLVGLLAPLLAPTRGQAADPPPKPNADANLGRLAQGMLSGLQTETLSNGLRVYLLPVKSSPIVTTMVAYKVGSADEEKDQTGLSHYLEHLMFKGTEKLLPGDIDRGTQRNGGHNNAYTSEDMTAYHFDFAADRWDIALRIEADRMRNIRIDTKHEFEKEKGAVISELATGDDQPWGLEYKRILPLLFPKDSPYSHPVIGEEIHVKAATAEIIKRHYDKWYHPNNAALVVVGGFDPDKAKARIKELFAAIPAGELPPRKPPTFYKDRAEPSRQEFVSKFEVPRVLIGFNTVPVGNPDDPVLDVIQTVLSEGRTSRLYRKLVEGEQLASEVSAGNNSGRYPGWFSVSAEVLPGKDRKKVEALLFAELKRLVDEPIEDAELERARRKILASFVFSRESVHSLADSIARVSTYPSGDDVAAFYRDYLTRLTTVSKADIQRVAKSYFDPKHASVVWSVPKDAEKRGGGQPQSGPSKSVTDSGEAVRVPRSTLPARSAQRKALEGAGASEFPLAGAKRVVLSNGITLILLEDHRLPIVVASVAIRDVSLQEPADKSGIAYLVGNLLEEGSDRHSGQEIATLIENTGGSMNLSAAGGGLKVLTPDTGLGLGLLFECLTRPAFAADALERQRDQQLSAIAEAETQPNTRAKRLFQSLVYGSHPFGRPSLGKKEVVEKLTAADCTAFHTEIFVPNRAIVVVAGDFQSDEMVKTVEGLTKDWKKKDVVKPQPAAPPKPTGVTEKIISDPTAQMVYVYIGHQGITRQNPDYHKLLVMDNVLGTGPGFTDRLSASLRDRQGLAYTVNATISTTAGNEPGTFTAFIAIRRPDKFIWVRDSIIKEIHTIRDEPPTEQEVEDAKRYLMGSLPFRFTSLSAIATELSAAERFGLGFDYLDRFQKEVAAVTPKDVQAVARKYLDPKTLTIVAVGPISQDGQPLGMKEK